MVVNNLENLAEALKELFESHLYGDGTESGYSKACSKFFAAIGYRHNALFDNHAEHIRQQEMQTRFNKFQDQNSAALRKNSQYR